jgi:hypothetical protein
MTFVLWEIRKTDVLDGFPKLKKYFRIVAMSASISVRRMTGDVGPQAVIEDWLPTARRVGASTNPPRVHPQCAGAFQ